MYKQYINKKESNMSFILNHTSPSIIETINSNHEYFEGALFFSTDIYTMTMSKEVHLYTLEINEDQVIDYYDLEPTQEIIEEAKHITNCLFDLTLDDDQIFDLITESEDINDLIQEALEEKDSSIEEYGYELIGELSWYVQGYQAKTARENGFIACRSEDEQGTVYSVHLVNREDLLTYKGEI